MNNLSTVICDPDKKWEQNLFTSLTTNGCEISLASNGKKAQQLLLEKPFDILIIDIETTNFSALEVIKFNPFYYFHSYQNG